MNKKISKNKTVLESDPLHGLRSIVSTLSQDHDDLRKLIEVLKSESKDFKKKKKAYKNFEKLLKSHAVCEEKAVYEIGLEFKDIKMVTFEAYEEHALAAELMRKIDKTSKPDQWMGRTKVLAEMVEHHIIEEENEYLLDLKKELESDQEKKMIKNFIKRRENSKNQPPEEFNGVLKN